MSLIIKRGKVSYEDELCPMLVRADLDYLAARLLFYNGIDDLAFYHLQQAAEKYLKAFLIRRRRGYPRGKKGHDLAYLRSICVGADQKEAFFNGMDVKTLCENLTDFALEGRYPHEVIQYYGYVPGRLIGDFDHFAFEIRSLVGYPPNCTDHIQAILQKKSTLCPPTEIASKFDLPGKGLGLEEAFLWNNQYFKRP